MKQKWKISEKAMEKEVIEYSYSSLLYYVMLIIGAIMSVFYPKLNGILFILTVGLLICYHEVRYQNLKQILFNFHILEERKIELDNKVKDEN